jgi:hypothetical protein
MRELDGERGKRKDKWERNRRDGGMKSAVRGRVSECGCGCATSPSSRGWLRPSFPARLGWSSCEPQLLGCGEHVRGPIFVAMYLSDTPSTQSSQASFGLQFQRGKAQRGECLGVPRSVDRRLLTVNDSSRRG